MLSKPETIQINFPVSRLNSVLSAYQRKYLPVRDDEVKVLINYN